MNADKKNKRKFKIGCQGWNYDDWITKADGETVFYPRGTRSDGMLETYAKMFETIEVDSTFYAIPPSANIENWYKKTPEKFYVFAQTSAGNHARVRFARTFVSDFGRILRKSFIAQRKTRRGFDSASTEL